MLKVQPKANTHKHMLSFQEFLKFYFGFRLRFFSKFWFTSQWSKLFIYLENFLHFFSFFLLAYLLYNMTYAYIYEQHICKDSLWLLLPSFFSVVIFQQQQQKNQQRWVLTCATLYFVIFFGLNTIFDALIILN